MDAAAEAERCTICLDSLDTSGEHAPLQLKCGHIYGAACIREWLSKDKKHGARCPQCQAPVAGRSEQRALGPVEGLQAEDGGAEGELTRRLEQLRARRRQVAREAELALGSEQRALARRDAAAQRLASEEASRRAARDGSAGPSVAATAATPAVTAVATTSTSAATLTEEQRQRAARNRELALQKKREREAAQARPAGVPARAEGAACALAGPPGGAFGCRAAPDPTLAPLAEARGPGANPNLPFGTQQRTCGGPW